MGHVMQSGAQMQGDLHIQQLQRNAQDLRAAELSAQVQIMVKVTSAQLNQASSSHAYQATADMVCGAGVHASAAVRHGRILRWPARPVGPVSSISAPQQGTASCHG